MNKMTFSPAITDLGYKKPDLLECYPDIDYEMIPIKEVFPVEQSNHFHIEQLLLSGMKNMLKQAQSFKLVSRSNAGSSSSAILHISNKKQTDTVTLSQKTDLTVLLPLRQIIKCKKTKKYTKFYLAGGQSIKTGIDFKKIKKCFLKNGFIKQKKSHLVSDSNGFHLPNASKLNNQM